MNRIKRAYPKITAGEWVQPVRKDFRMACCDCGLVHKLDFRLVKFGKGHKIQFRPWLFPRATAVKRRGKHDFTKAK